MIDIAPLLLFLRRMNERGLSSEAVMHVMMNVPCKTLSELEDECEKEHTRRLEMKEPDQPEEEPKP